MTRMFTKSETIVEVKMKVLLVFLLAVPASNRAEAEIISECELKRQLKTEIDNLPPKEKQALSGETVLAKLVCHAYQATAFNTSAVKTQISVTDGRFQRNVNDPPPRPKPSTLPPPEDDDETFWGIFQFSNYVVCSDGVITSLNFCGVHCRDFIDSDIRDDIICLLKILVNFLHKAFETDVEIQRMIRFILEPKCSDAPVLDCP